jgi:outer membrane immunogenic protein
MKKLALALVASTLGASAASANISTGFYLGGHVGYGSTTGKFTNQLANVPTNGSADFGVGAGNIGIFGGYGWVTGCMYFGGEIGYTFENTKIRDSLNSGGNFGSSELKRNGYFNMALRGGYLFTPNTMLYVRLGGNWGKWHYRDSLNSFNNTNPGRGHKNRLSFAPGVGLETAIHKHVYLRGEYTYEFGPSVRAVNSVLPTFWSNIGTIRSQSFKLGLSYKF